MDVPYITIGVCVRNCERTIMNTIHSIIYQDYPHQKMELIIVDDGSTDRTFEYLKQLISKSDIFTKIYRQRWKGLGASRNIVIKNAKGKYIIWVDGDMILPKNYVYNHVKFMELNPKVAIAKANYKILKKLKLVEILEGVARVYTLSGSNELLGTGGCIFRTEVIKEIGGFDENIHGAGEDIDVVLKVKQKRWVICKNIDVTFIEIFKDTWSALWRQYYWYGYGAHYVNHKHKLGLCILYRLPISSFFIGILKFFKIFKAYPTKLFVLLPIHYTFKNVAWLYGFIKSHFDAYGHTKRN